MPLERNYRLQVGLESAYGDGGSTPTDVPAFFDGLPQYEHTRHENPTYSGSIARAKFFLGKTQGKATIKFFMKGSGTAATPTELAKLFKIVGMSETISTDVAYSPINTSFPSAGLTFNLDGTQYILNGVRAESFNIPLEAGNPVIAEMSVVGRYTTPTSVALGSPTFADAAITPPIVESMALTIASQTHFIPKMTWELKNVIAAKESINSANRGFSEFAIVGREWGGSFQVEVDTNNDLEWWTNLIGATEMAVASTGFGSTGNMIQISTSTMQLEDIKPSALNGTRMYDVAFRINKHATLASEFKLTTK
jgi:hypothetical protein